nr:LysM domain-containing protein [Paenarthrobacter aurescens]
MARTLRSDMALAASIPGLGLFLVLVGNTLVGQWQAAQYHHQGFSFEHLLGLLVSAAGAALVAWWVLSMVLAFFASVMHRKGQEKGAEALSKFSPAFMLRLAAAVVSFNLLGAPLALASAAPPDPGWQPAAVGTVHPFQAAWTPTSFVGASDISPTADTATAGTLSDDPRWQPRPPVIEPGLLSSVSSRQTSNPNQASVIVQTGDSLWSIAASRLGPFATDVDIALAWPQWYEANRSTIGSDPAVLLPGQVLRAPMPG